MYSAEEVKKIQTTALIVVCIVALFSTLGGIAVAEFAHCGMLSKEYRDPLCKKWE